MFNRFQVTLRFEHNQQLFELNGNDHHPLAKSRTTFENAVLKVHLSPKTSIKLKSITCTWHQKLDKTQRVFFNGYQSWTDSQELSISDKMPLSPFWVSPVIAKYQLDKYGDGVIRPFKKGRGQFHGFTYAYIKTGDQYELIASLNERSGFTMIEYTHGKGLWTLSKDIEDLIIQEDTTLLDVAGFKGLENDVFDQVFKKMDILPRSTQALKGWTSWYYHYQNINESIILHNLKHYSQLNSKLDVFQIDDGYQSAVGDWLHVDQDKFPSGMKMIADDIHHSKMKAGLWLAPFVCEEKSLVFKQHPEWLLKDGSGHLLQAGINWGGFYVLNLELQEVQDHLRHVFKVILDEWSYDLVKLDFLYAACILSSPTKSRGQLMAEAMDFLRDCVGDKLILACGVPLASCFGVVDYCRIGADVGLDWDDTFYMRWMHRERISTYRTLNNSIGRHHLNQRAFINDPDVFILRNEGIKLSSTQKETLATINKLFGGAIFTSDDPANYDAEQQQKLESLMSPNQIEILKKTCISKGVYEVISREQNITSTTLINTSSKAITFASHKRTVMPYESIKVETI